MPYVTVIMPVYNTEQWVGDAIQSILTQSYTDFELIIINDGSTDQSLERIHFYANSDKRITVICQENKGLSAARNRGLMSAQGEYIYFMDSDDILEHNALNICVKYAIENQLDLVVFSADIFSDSALISHNFENYQKPDILAPCPGANLLSVLMKKNAYSACAWLYLSSRDLIQSMSQLFDEGYLHEDEGFTPELYCRAKKTVSLSKKLFRRRIRSDSIMTRMPSFDHISGSIQAAVRINALLNNLTTIPSDTRHVLRRHQCMLIRRSRKTAESINQTTQFKSLVNNRLNLSNLAAIDPAMVIYLKANTVYCGFRRLWYLLK